ncbi:MAG: ankyrin repeat domain-containing protein [Sedimentisphaerales bacterium]|nr:ankyrin repeat domain-containing protein [Sedimentisphaerales bacterium]
MYRRLFISLVFSLSFLVPTNSLHAENQELPSFVQIISESTPQQIQELLQNNMMDVNTKINDLDWTPLHAAVRFGRKDVIDLILDKQPDLNARDKLGQTPLYLAIETGNKEIVETLISRGVNVNIATNNGDNPLSMAEKIGLSNIRDILVQHDATLPEPGAINQGMPGSRRGMPGANAMFPGNMNSRMGGPGDNNINMDPAIGQMDQNVTATAGTPDNMIMPVEQFENSVSGFINLEPNEVKARIQNYEGLEKAVADVADGSKSSLRQWRRAAEDNRTTLINAVRRQFEDEVEFAKKIAEEEKAVKTVAKADELIAARKKAFIAISNEVRNDQQQRERQNTGTTTSSRRSRGTTAMPMTTTRGSRRGTSQNTTNITPPVAEEPKSTYASGIQTEVDTWLNASIENAGGRMSLMESVTSKIISEISSLKQIAEGENANKTIAAIDGLLLARQNDYNEVRNELEKIQQEQGTPIITDMPETLIDAPIQDMTTGRGRRGR